MTSRYESFNVCSATYDPDNFLNGKPILAMSTMLYKLCDGDDTKFIEGMRLVDLFIEKALEK